jgi:hypothetical protein
MYKIKDEYELESYEDMHSEYRLFITSRYAAVKIQGG